MEKSKNKQNTNNNTLGKIIGTALVGLGGMALGFVASEMFNDRP